MKEALSRFVRLDPLSIEDKLRDCTLTRIGDYLLCGAGCFFDIDFGVGNCMLVEEALRLAAIAAPVGGIDKKFHVLIVADSRRPGKGGEEYTGDVRASSASAERSGTGENHERNATP